jgi:hypothetical protein
MQRKYLAVGVSFIMLIAALAIAQQPPEDKSKRPSPPATAEVTLKGKKVAIDYSRPSLKGRKVGQELAPYGQVWRTGANEATTLTTEVDLNIGGVKVPAGKYTLYTLPSEGTWKLIINKQTGQWGLTYNQSRDLGRVKMTMSKPPAKIETYKMTLSSTGPKAGKLQLEWDNYIASVPITVK